MMTELDKNLCKLQSTTDARLKLIMIVKLFAVTELYLKIHFSFCNA